MVRVKGRGQSLDGSYVIAADGANSQVAEVTGYNKDRTYYFNLYGLSWYMPGVELPEPNTAISNYGLPQGIATMLFLVP